MMEWAQTTIMTLGADDHKMKCLDAVIPSVSVIIFKSIVSVISRVLYPSHCGNIQYTTCKPLPISYFHGGSWQPVVAAAGSLSWGQLAAGSLSWRHLTACHGSSWQPVMAAVGRLSWRLRFAYRVFVVHNMLPSFMLYIRLHHIFFSLFHHREFFAITPLLQRNHTVISGISATLAIRHQNHPNGFP